MEVEHFLESLVVLWSQQSLDGTLRQFLKAASFVGANKMLR
jgi:hypothetical protein